MKVKHFGINKKGRDFVVGDSPVAGIVQLGNHFFIDTGAVFKSGFLTVVQING